VQYSLSHYDHFGEAKTINLICSLFLLAIQGDSKKADGVVLFMHGFSQGPNAYYKLMEDLADAGFLVVAPEPPFAPTRGKQQVRQYEGKGFKESFSEYRC
jgi:hypothetical protein